MRVEYSTPLVNLWARVIQFFLPPFRKGGNERQTLETRKDFGKLNGSGRIFALLTFENVVDDKQIRQEGAEVNPSVEVVNQL